MATNDRTADRIKQRRLDRMRLGNSVCSIEKLVSDPEIRVALVPLTEAEYDFTLEVISTVQLPDTVIALQRIDRQHQREIMAIAIREPNDLDQRMFKSAHEVGEALETADVNFLWESYLEMVDQSSPSIDSIPPDEIELLKKVLQTIDWNELSGRSWFALKRFLSAISQEPHLANSLGSIFSSLSITKSDDERSISTASPSGNEKSARSATNQSSM
jgi:hypothetical protein